MIFDEPLATFVEVILPLPLPKLFTYRVPKEYIETTQIGKRVVVQFGKKKLYSAIVFNISNTPPAGYEAKFFLGLVDETPIVTEQQLKFWVWLVGYYLCTLGDVMNAALPAGLKMESETIISLNPDADLTDAELTDKEHLIVEALTITNLLTIDNIAQILEIKNVFSVLKGLYNKGIILYTEDIKEGYKPKTVTCIKLGPNFMDELALQVLFESLEKQPKQLEALMAFMHLKKQQDFVTKKQLIEYGGFSDSTIKTLAKKEVFIEYKQAIDRIMAYEDELVDFKLNENQQEAVLQIKTQFESKDVVLLHGVTSSGKTHVYVQLIEEQLQQGKQVLFLLPEIALTSQIIQRLKKYFGNSALAYHSKFNTNERVEIWQKVSKGQPMLIIGARSSIFLPFVKLGLIVVDEEHESSYKQNDPAPRYQARDASVFLAHLFHAKVLLGSATPSFESYYNTKQNKYGLVQLKNRYGQVNLPQISLANIAEDTRTKSMYGYFTTDLYHAIQNALAQKQQVILFQNRRGYAPILECTTCHNTTKCINCDINLTYHKYNDTLKCHYCGYTAHPPKNCVSCGSNQIHLKGFGTEKIEDEMKVFFPEARVLRLDLDSTRSKFGHDAIIKSFEMHEADILIGTQMLSKGLDFGKVSLVGVMNADQLLYFPDFRAHERAYQLLTQVSGRAGRSNVQGQVIIQTSTPNHHVLQEVLAQNYTHLFANELAERERFLYPPFTRLIKITLKHKDYQTCHEAAFALQRLLFAKLGSKVIGPESPFVSRIRNLFIKELLIKIDRNHAQLHVIKQFITQQCNAIITTKEFKQVMVYADVDPG